MNDKLNSLINTFGIPVLAIAGTAVTAVTKLPLPLTLASGLLASVVGNKVTEIELINRLKNVSPDKLNHDVLHVSKFAAKLAMKATVDCYHNNGKITESACKVLKKKIDELCKQLDDSEIWESVEDIINYENEFHEKSKLSDTLSVELKEINDIFEDSDFNKTFQGYFHLYFGEYLKTNKFRPALVAYEREMQKMILKAVNNLENRLDSREINRVIKESIAQYINEIPAVVENSEMRAEFAKELSEIKRYFEAKKIIIREIKTDKLIIEIPPNEIKEISNNYEALQAIIDGKYYFEYNNRLHSIDELNEETFDYLAGKIKYNQLFTKKIIEAIENDCAQQHPNFYRVIKQTGDTWDILPRYCNEGKNIISDSFVGVIGKQMDKLFAIGKDTDAPEEIIRKRYIEKCRSLVRRTLDLAVFAFLAQLWDDVYRQKLTLSAENPLRGHFTMDLKTAEQFALLRHLIDIYSKHKTDHSTLLIADIILVAENFTENSELYAACTGLEKLGDNPAPLDCYLAEKHLITFFEIFRFLVNYKVASMKKIEYFNIKNIDTGYLHHYVNLGYSRKSLEEERRNFDNCTEVSSLFTNAVLLYKGNDYTKNINLFPFVIDYNALTLEKNSKIAFFRQPAFDEDCLEYVFLDTDETFELEYKGIVQQKGNKNEVFLTDEDMKIYNKDCVLATFRMIRENLFV